MKKIIINIFILLFIFFLNINVYAEESKMTQDLAVNILLDIEKNINEGNTDYIISKLSPNANPLIKEGILSNIKGKKIKFFQELKNIEDL